MRPTAGAAQDRLAQRRRRRSGSASPSSAGAVPGTPASRAIAPTVRRRVAGEHLQRRRPRAAKKATVSAAFGRSRSASTTRPSGLHVARGTRRPGRRPAAAPRRGRARARAARRPPRARPAATSAGSAAREPLRRARARARSSPRSSALQRRRDENGTCATARRRPSPPPSPASRDRLQRRVARRGARRVARRARAASVASSTPAAGTSADHAQRRLGQRAGLVGADDVDRRERLDRVELLGEHPAPGHLEGGHRRGEADQQDQPLGDEVDDPRGQRPGRVGRLAVSQRQESRRAATASGARDRRAAAAEPVDRPLERGARVAEGPRRRGQPRGAAVRPDRRDLEGAVALDGERARPDRVAARPRTTGSDSPVRLRLVEREPVRARQRRRRRRPGRRP